MTGKILASYSVGSMVSLRSPIKVKDRWGVEWPVQTFRIVRSKPSGRMVDVMFCKDGKPYVAASRKVTFEGLESKASGDATIKVGRETYKVGFWKEAS